MRGNGKVIQELERQFRGSGWNVIKVVWGRLWDPIIAKDKGGHLQKIMDEVVDGEMQISRLKEEHTLVKISLVNILKHLN